MAVLPVKATIAAPQGLKKLLAPVVAAVLNGTPDKARALAVISAEDKLKDGIYAVLQRVEKISTRWQTSKKVGIFFVLTFVGVQRYDRV